MYGYEKYWIEITVACIAISDSEHVNVKACQVQCMEHNKDVFSMELNLLMIRKV